MNIIKVRGARQHNLKDIDVDLPQHQLVVITGLSGSGKSTLAFDTLYAEGQRRYVESLSAYARQYLERLEKPDVDLIEGLSPAIAIEQRSSSHNPRSTVGTVTDIYDYLRLLYANIGVAHCYQCGARITSQSIDQMVGGVEASPLGTRIIVLAPVVQDQSGSHASLIKRLRRDGFARLRVDGVITDIESAGPLDKKAKHTIEVVVDRLIRKENQRNRLADSMELAISLSEGSVSIELQAGDAISLLHFSEKATCPRCDISYPDFEPASFSFNSPQGACSACDGLGSRAMVAEDLLVPDRQRSLREGAVAPWANRESTYFTDFLEAFAKTYGADIDTPFKDLPTAFQEAIFHGSKDKSICFTLKRASGHHVHDRPFEGLKPQLERRYHEGGSDGSREDVHPYIVLLPCPSCRGARLRRSSRHVHIDGKAIYQLTAGAISDTLDFFKELELDGQAAVIGEKIINKITERLQFLKEVGLSYLTLDRTAHTLSGGESQRIRLATQIGAKLTGVLYVLDEPSIGLHPRDSHKLLQCLFRMRALGNTVLVVEHDPDTIMAADHVIDMGPGAGIKGGHVIFSGPPQALLQAGASLTGQYLNGTLEISTPEIRRSGNGNTLTITGARCNNLKSIDVSFPLGSLICVTGVSGSGKSSLVTETLYQAVRNRRAPAHNHGEHYDQIMGLEHIDNVINVDQAPIGKTPRSNPGTYTRILGHVRDLFSNTPEARMRGYKPGRFSFNVKGGRCEACKGDGIIKIEMHFLPDIYVTCDICGGKRFNRETLEVRYKGRNISEVLDLTVNQALADFGRIGAIRTKLETMIDVGLGYIRLGQPATTLSGGEAQRIKLSRELSKRGTGRTLYILDEPTTGLHMEDVSHLLKVLNRLVDNGDTVVVIEHHLDVIKSADHIIDLGPEGGDAGGFLVAATDPVSLTMEEASHTGRYLKGVLGL